MKVCSGLCGTHATEAVKHHTNDGQNWDLWWKCKKDGVKIWILWRKWCHVKCLVVFCVEPRDHLQETMLDGRDGANILCSCFNCRRLHYISLGKPETERNNVNQKQVCSHSFYQRRAFAWHCWLELIGCGWARAFLLGTWTFMAVSGHKSGCVHCCFALVISDIPSNNLRLSFAKTFL